MYTMEYFWLTESEWENNSHILGKVEIQKEFIEDEEYTFEDFLFDNIETADFTIKEVGTCEYEVENKSTQEKEYYSLIDIY